jgi:hypothetical protein
MRAKMGNEFPKMGNGLPISAAEPADLTYELMIALAVRRELGNKHHAIKTLMKRTGASSRTAKNWLSGAAGPNGRHLVELMRSSDPVFEAVLKFAGRETGITSARVAEARGLIVRAELLLGSGDQGGL